MSRVPGVDTTRGHRVTFEPYMVDKEIQVNIFNEFGDKIAFCFIPVDMSDKMVGQIFDAKDRIVNRAKYEVARLEEKLKQVRVQQMSLEDETKDIQEAINDLRKKKNDPVQSTTQKSKGEKSQRNNKDRKQTRKSKSKSSTESTKPL